MPNGTCHTRRIPVEFRDEAISIFEPLKEIETLSAASLSEAARMFWVLLSGSRRKLSSGMSGGIKSLIGKSKATTVARCPGWLKVVRRVK